MLLPSVVFLVQQPLKAAVATKMISALSCPCPLRPRRPSHRGSETPWQLWLGRDQARATAAVTPCVRWGDNEGCAHPRCSAGLWPCRNELVGHAEHCAMLAVRIACWKSPPPQLLIILTKRLQGIKVLSPRHSRNRDPAMEKPHVTSRPFITTRPGVSRRFQE